MDDNTVIDVDSGDPIEIIKHEIRDRHGVPLSQQRLVNAGRQNSQMEDHSSTNMVERAIAPSAWQSLSFVKCQILAILFIDFRLSDVAFLAFGVSC